MSGICAFCGGGEIPADCENPAQLMAAHILGCEKHPLHEATKQLAAKDARITKLLAAARFFRNGWLTDREDEWSDDEETMMSVRNDGSPMWPGFAEHSKVLAEQPPEETPEEPSP